MSSGPGTFPRVLVVDACPFNRHRNTGILKSTFFEGWPKDKLAQIDYSNVEPGFDVCADYWRLTKSDVLKSLVGSSVSGAVAPPAANVKPEKPSPTSDAYESRPPLERSLGWLPKPMRDLVGEGLFFLPSVLSKPLKSWIDRFNPEVLFSLVSNPMIMRTVLRIARLRGIPAVPYFTDDWPSTLYDDHFAKWALERNLQNLLPELLERSPVRLTASEAMAREYRRRYGGKFVALLQAIDPSTIARVEEPPETGRDVVRIAFIGSLAPNRWRSLRTFGEALLVLRGEGLHVELCVWAFPSEIQEFGTYITLPPVIRIMGTASPGEVPELQRDADLLLHVESFDRETCAYTRLSLSTKIPQYFAAGRGLIAYGPRELASVQYVEECGAGIAISSEDPVAVADALRVIVTNTEIRRAYARAALTAARANHDANTIRESFRQTMALAAEVRAGSM